MLSILGLFLNVIGAVLLGYFTQLEFSLLYMIPMLMFNFAGMCIASSNSRKY